MAPRSSPTYAVKYLALVVLFARFLTFSTLDGDESLPLVMVAVLARNAAHSLPNSLGYLEGLDYPKHRMSIWIRTDHNEDNTLSMLSEWTENVQHLYASVHLHHSDEWLYPNRDPFAESEERYLHLAKLRQEGLDEARKIGADYLLWMDCDTFIVNNRTLRILIDQQKPIISPMLDTAYGRAHSNFWCGQNEQGYYLRTPDYLPILQRDMVGCFQVPVVHSSVLIDLQTPESRGLVYWPPHEGFDGPVDEVIQFTYSVKQIGLSSHVLNSEIFGFIVKTEEYLNLKDAERLFINFKLETLVNHPPVRYSEYISREGEAIDKRGLDEIFVIGLERRPERRNRMVACMGELKIKFTLFDAIDGRKLNQTYLDELGIHYLPGWTDPWGERPMTFGEVGCFLSHYFIWKEMLERDLQEVLVLEDDVHFEPNFKDNLQVVLNEAGQYAPSWDLIYVGRKILHWDSEKLVTGTTKLAVPHYSYWTLGYIISQSGARKLIEANPFEKLLPVDEYLPIMFGTHPEDELVAHFPERNLNAYSAYPLLVNPTHYVGDKEWFSDTEPPIEVLERIRARKAKEEEEEEKMKEEEDKGRERNVEDDEKRAHREKVRKEAVRRQIEAMKQKFGYKTEL